MLILTLAFLYALLYLLISQPHIQDSLRSSAINILRERLEVPIDISRIELSPFSRIELFNVIIPDQQGDTLLYAKKIGVGISLNELAVSNRICLNNIQLFGMDANIVQETPTSATNLQFIIDAFAPQEKQEPMAIDLQINSAMIRRSSISYNVLSEPALPDSCLDYNHIDVKDLNTTLNIRALRNDSLNVHIKRFSCKEESGLDIKHLSLQAIANPCHVALSDFELQLPHSHVTPKIEADLDNIKQFDEFVDRAYFYVELDNSKVQLSDIAAIVPDFYKFNTPIHITCKAEGKINNFTAHNLVLDMGGKSLTLNARGSVQNILDYRQLHIDNGNVQLHTKSNAGSLIKKNLDIADATLQEILKNCHVVDFNSRISGDISKFKADLQLKSGLGDLSANLLLNGNSDLTAMGGRGHIESNGIDFTKIGGDTSALGIVAFNTDIDGKIKNNKLREAHFEGQISRIDFNQYSYKDITIDAQLDKDCYSGKIDMLDTNGSLHIDGSIQLEGKNAFADFAINCQEIDLAALNLLPQANGNKLSFDIDANYTGNQLDNANGYVHINNIYYGNSNDSFKWEQLHINAHNSSKKQEIAITSDYLNGKIEGDFTLATLTQTFRNIASQFIPTIVPPISPTASNTLPTNDIHWYLNIKPHIKMANILKFPITLTDTASIEGCIGDSLHVVKLDVSAPNMWIGLTHLEKLSVNLDNKDKELQLSAQTNIVNAQQDATLFEVKACAENDSIEVDINWDAHSNPIYNGSISLDTQLSKVANDSNLNINIDILPTQFTINDTTWHIKPANISIQEKNIKISDIDISRPSQHVYINGKISPNPQDTLHVDLKEVNLDYIFNTLNIDFVTFGGYATGRVDVADLYGATPYIRTRKLDIRNFSYNDTEFGDLSAFSMLDTESMGILIKGIIADKEKTESYVDGYIFPTKDSLSIAFDATNIPLRFIRPFINTILVDADGTASGHLVLEGTFEKITVFGDAYAHDFSFGVPFINTRYHLSDSIHFEKDRIYFDNVTVYDIHNKTAKGRGEIKHKYFTQVDYDIDIYNADKVLVFDVAKTTGVPYYGTIYGSGNVKVVGNEYNTNIGVNMTPARNSTFSFVLTNTTSATDYQFLTFSNKREMPVKEEVVISEIDSLVMHNNMLMEKRKKVTPIQNVMDLSITANINPDSEINIVMNEITGDKMQGYGEGVLRLDFNTANNEILMYGTMNVNKGTYDFSIEDIITRNFKIHEGGTVSFQGNPLEAMLNISATYSLQANLADLDASFTGDSEITRTNVPVNAVLNINGPLMKPDIDFDIKLPTLSSDTEDRVNSIINTEEMMTRQVIYLLVLNRFYTAEYSTQNQSYNELGAMAASTISSSIGALMGQISENWTISPKLRSERGDFSDLEVDLYLSSQLLNNRLLFNGSFGYRDSRYYTTNFIGDFDIEYLLTENGNLRLKGYNHFNDRNHTMRTAITTQGLGLVYKHDFNTWKNFFEFSNIKLFNEEEYDDEEEEEEEEYDDEYDNTLPADTIVTITPDILE